MEHTKKISLQPHLGADARQCANAHEHLSFTFLIISFLVGPQQVPLSSSSRWSHSTALFWAYSRNRSTLWHTQQIPGGKFIHREDKVKAEQTPVVTVLPNPSLIKISKLFLYGTEPPPPAPATCSPRRNLLCVGLTAQMGMFAETAIIDYPLSFANQGNQAICRFLSLFAANKRKFLLSVSSVFRIYI